MTQASYEFAHLFKKTGIQSQTFSIVPTTKEQKERMDKITKHIKEFINECEKAYHTPKKSTIRFCQKKISHTR